ncbi:HAMP domain-containing methyl-accepting chemotaxis protein [Chitinimonas sp.]|uniref:methyl-accepting chemotaxis protein n=1 Tax=Chitinimonas sp. TaxID=1934313 RepID=UPI002F931430
MSLKNLRTSSKLFLAFAIVAAGFMGLLLLAQHSIESIRSNTAQVNRLNRNLADFKEIRFNMHDVRSEVLAALLVRDNSRAAGIAARFKRLTEDDAEALRRLEVDAAGDPELKRLVTEVKQLWLDFVDVRDNQIVPRLADGRYDEARVLSTGAQGARVTHLRQLAAELDQAIGQRIVVLEARNQDLIEQQLVRMFWIGGLLLLLATGLAWSLSNSIAKPLQLLTHYARQISVGEIPQQAELTDRQDELGELSQAFSRMGDYLQQLALQAEQLAGGDLGLTIKPHSERDLLGISFVRMVESLSQLAREIRESVVVIASASEEILATSGQVAGGAQDSASAISEIATTIEEVKQTASMAHQRAAEVSDATSRNRQIAIDGRSAISQTLSSMGQVREQMHAMAENVMRLSEQSQAIGDIVATVNDLAEQTNLLGVNASIEAGKAGDAGRGFAVVALEVKALAEQSKQATNQVRTILGDVQRAMTKAAMAAEQGSKAVDTSFEHTRLSDEAIRDLADSVELSNDVAQEIATTSQQQLAGIEQVVAAMSSIRRTSRDNAAGAQQVDQSAHDLHDLGSRLKQAVERFRLASDSVGSNARATF